MISCRYGNLLNCVASGSTVVLQIHLHPRHEAVHHNAARLGGHRANMGEGCQADGGAEEVTRLLETFCIYQGNSA